MAASSDTESDFGFPQEGQTHRIQINPLQPIEPDTKTIVGGDSITEGEPKKNIVPIGGAIGKYEIRSQLGAGGMGAVYLAFDPLIEREVAIKVLTQEVGTSSVALQRFLQEARSIGRLNHPNVVSIFDIDQWNGQYYLVMELISGGSLAEVVDGGCPLPWQEACRIIAQAASGLAAAHAAGMVHRDVKPENLMLTKDGLVKVVDFGLSKLVDAANDTRTAVTKQGQILGTPHYMSPEQFDASELDLRTDIYSLGGSLFRLLTSQFPFQDCTTIVQTMMAHLNKPVPLVSAIDPKIPKECDRIIARAMAKQPASRYQNANEMAEELMALVHSARGFGESSSAVSRVDGLGEQAELAPIINEVVPLKSVVIVEPNKMLAAMMRDSVARCGATRIVVSSSKAEAIQAIGTQVPNLLVTAMELAEGRGIELVSELCTQLPWNRSCVVLNSSDSTIEELIEAGSVASRVLAPKKIRPDDVLRVVHAAGPCKIEAGVIAAPLDPFNLRLVVLTDFGSVPRALEQMIRNLEILDVSVLDVTDIASIPTGELPTVVLRLRSSGRIAGDEKLFAKLSSWLPTSRHLIAEVQLEGDVLLLRAVFRQGVTASICRVFDTERLVCLLQSCRSS